jgi:hypothetical protein
MSSPNDDNAPRLALRPLGFDGVCKRQERPDHTVFLGVMNAAPNLMPREGVDAGSNGDSSKE